MCATTHKPHKAHMIDKQNTKNIDREHFGYTLVVYTVNDSPLKKG
jgi:hypothetical protein